LDCWLLSRVGSRPAFQRDRQTFDAARATFDMAWQWLLTKFTEADFTDYERHRAFDAWKRAMWDAGLNRRRWRLVGQRTSAVQRSVSRMSRATSHASRALPAGFEKTVAHAYLGCMAYAFAVSPCRGLASEIFGLQRLVGHPNGLNWTTKCSRRQADHAAKSALIERAVGPPKHAHRRVAAALSNDSVRGARRSTSASRAYPAECGACVLNRWRTQTREDKP
jgi:hypothetical protein